MKKTANELISAMQMLENPEQRKVLMGFFKTGKGQYGEGDEFLRLKVPETRAFAKEEDKNAILNLYLDNTTRANNWDLVVGWLLREMGKRCGIDELRDFLSVNASTMPRTALRYAIEKMDKDEREYWMNKKNRGEEYIRKDDAAGIEPTYSHHSN